MKKHSKPRYKTMRKTVTFGVRQLTRERMTVWNDESQNTELVNVSTGLKNSVQFHSDSIWRMSKRVLDNYTKVSNLKKSLNGSTSCTVCEWKVMPL